MKTLIFILVILSFLQATIIPMDLVLIVLICRSFIKTEKSNLYLAFGFGLLLSLLTGNPVGLQSITFLILVTAVELSKPRLLQNALLVAVVCFVAIIINSLAIAIFTHTSFMLIPKIFGGFLSLPIFYIVRFWEERFIIRKEIRLKI